MELSSLLISLFKITTKIFNFQSLGVVEVYFYVYFVNNYMVLHHLNLDFLVVEPQTPHYQPILQLCKCLLSNVDIKEVILELARRNKGRIHRTLFTLPKEDLKL